MGGGASAPQGAPQGVEARNSGLRRSASNAKHYKFALVQCEMLKDCIQDSQMAINCLRSINEAMNDNVESRDTNNIREELCGVGLDTTALALMGTFPRDEEVARECLIAVHPCVALTFFYEISEDEPLCLYLGVIETSVAFDLALNAYLFIRLGAWPIGARIESCG